MNLPQNLKRIRRIAKELPNLRDDDRSYLQEALYAIGNGQDPSVALGIAGNRGVRRSIVTTNRRRQLALAWLKAAVTPTSEGGLGLSRKQALDLISGAQDGNPFTLEVGSIDRYTREYPSEFALEFKLPD